MNDVVERLRKWANVVPVPPAADAMLEAAKEIEHLRRTLASIERFCETGSVFDAMFGDIKAKRTEVK